MTMLFLAKTFAAFYFRDKIFYQRRIGTAAPNNLAKMKAIQESIEGYEVSERLQLKYME